MGDWPRKFDPQKVPFVTNDATSTSIQVPTAPDALASLVDPVGEVVGPAEADREVGGAVGATPTVPVVLGVARTYSTRKSPVVALSQLAD